MDPYSFLNTAHSAYFAELYDQYLINPESVEPSWRAFFQGFEFGIDKAEKGELHIPENIVIINYLTISFIYTINCVRSHSVGTSNGLHQSMVFHRLI